MAYGQTGTGKTHTIVKDILPQSVGYLMKFIEKSEKSLYFSAIQVYNEKLSDLVDLSKKLRLREKGNSFFIDNLFEKKVTSEKELQELINKTESNRKKGVTSLNVNSSRSHAVYMFKLIQKDKQLVSQLNLVDLAGSERIDKSKIKTEKFGESISINTSLTALSRCIVNMSGKKSAHIPFRESILTKILMNSLSGNSKTCLIVTLSSNYNDIDETIASLSFAQRACKVKVKPIINSNSEKVDKKFLDEIKNELIEKDSIIDTLTTEINELKNQHPETEELKEEIAELKDYVESKLKRPINNKQAVRKREL